MPKPDEAWSWIDRLIEEGVSATIGFAEDPLDLLMQQEEDLIQDTGHNLNHRKVSK